MQSSDVFLHMAVYRRDGSIGATQVYVCVCIDWCPGSSSLLFYLRSSRSPPVVPFHGYNKLYNAYLHLNQITTIIS